MPYTPSVWRGHGVDYCTLGQSQIHEPPAAAARRINFELSRCSQLIGSAAPQAPVYWQAACPDYNRWHVPQTRVGIILARQYYVVIHYKKAVYQEQRHARSALIPSAL
jgi:hypothetical protein